MRGVTRRDFLNGAALTIAAGLTPAMQFAARGRPLIRRRLTGMRGHHPGSFEAAHDMRDGKIPRFDNLPIDERYDLVVVGAGISGLSAAHFYRKANPNARILILDNHDDFGGHAKRNEFTLNRRLILGYGGSESLQSPKGLFSATVKGLMKDLGVDPARFETAFERKLYPSLGLSRGVFFPREAFGRDALVTGDPQAIMADDLGPGLLNARGIRQFVADFPVSAESKAQLIALYEETRDPLPDKSAEEKTALLEKTSYSDYLTKVCGYTDEVAKCFYGRTLDFTGLSAEQVPASFAREMGFPGFAALGLPTHDNPERTEPYIYHFPDGNASIARLLVRTLIPGIAPGKTMDDIVLARFNYGRLDRPDQRVRIRLESTVINVRNAQGAVDVAYMRGGKVARVQAQALRARLFQHGHSLSDARIAAGSGARLAGECEGAAGLHQGADPQLAVLREARRARDFRADVVSLPRQARLSGQHGALSSSARSVRADVLASRACAERFQSGTGSAQSIPHRPHEIARHDIRRFRDEYPRRSRPHAGAGRIFVRAGYRGDHGQPLVARLFLCGEFAVRRART